LGVVCGIILLAPYRIWSADISGRHALNGETSPEGGTENVDLTTALTLTDLVKLALENSVGLGSARYDLQIAGLVKKDADRLYWPRVKGGVDFVIDDGFENEAVERDQLRPFLTISQNELNNIENYKKLRNAATRLTGAKIDLLKAKRQLIALVTDRYFAVYLNQKQLELDEKDLAAHQRNFNELRLKYQDGLVAQIETLQAETALSTIELRLQKSKNDLTHSIMALAVTVGLSAESQVQIAAIEPNELFDISWDQCRDIGLRNNAELKIYEESAQEMKRLHQSASWTRWPSFSAKVYIGENPPQDFNTDANMGATLTLSQNLFDAGETNRLISRAGIEMRQHQILVQYYRQTFINRLRLQYNRFVNSKEELALATQKHELAKKLFDLTKRNYELGSISLEEKRKAEETIRRSEIMYSRAKVNYLAAETNLKIEMRNDPWQNQDVAPNADRVNDIFPSK
jgi:outer membrane protein TolC